jgi:hypothetical protein
VRGGATLAERSGERQQFFELRNYVGAGFFGPYLPTCNLAVRRADLEAVDGFAEIRSGGDADLCWRVLERPGRRLATLPEVLMEWVPRDRLRDYLEQNYRYGRSNYALRVAWGEEPPVAVSPRRLARKALGAAARTAAALPRPKRMPDAVIDWGRVAFDLGYRPSGEDASFSEPTDRYQLFQLAKEEWTNDQELPEGYYFIRAKDIDRDQERALLQTEFPHWEVPFNRQMPGSYDTGIYCVGYEGKIVALSYGCTENELGIPGYAQIHYAVVDPEHRGKKLLAAMVTEMFRRGPEFKGGVFYVDRSGHQQMYERWGGHLKGEKEKPETDSGFRGMLARARRRLSSRAAG